MRFKSQQRRSKTPPINLIPMLDVMMIILIYLIVFPRILTKEIPAKEPPPNTNSSKNDSKKPGAIAEPLVNPVVIELNSQSQILFGEQLINEDQLVEQVKAYMAQNPKGGFILKADPQLPYNQVVRVLELVRSAGGDRISLAY